MCVVQRRGRGHDFLRSLVSANALLGSTTVCGSRNTAFTVMAASAIPYDCLSLKPMVFVWCRPDDVFALFYGFLPRELSASQLQQPQPDGSGPPEPAEAAAVAAAQQPSEAHPQPLGNPHDKVTLFADVRHVADFVVAQFGPQNGDDAALESWADAIAENLIAALGDNYQRCTSSRFHLMSELSTCLDCNDEHCLPRAQVPRLIINASDVGSNPVAKSHTYSCRLFMTPVGFDERLAMATLQLLRTRLVPLGWPADALDSDIAQQPLQPSALTL